MDFKSPTIFKIETDYINNSFYPDLYSINKNVFDCNNSITFPEKYCYNEYFFILINFKLIFKLIFKLYSINLTKIINKNK